MIYKPLNTAIRLYLKHRYKRIEAMQGNSLNLQEKVKEELWSNLRHTKYVRSNGANNISELPVVEYDQIKPFVQQMMMGEKDVLWPGTIDWYSKSSGTTSDRSKYLPITDDLFYQNIIAASWDTTSIVYQIWKNATLFSAKNLIMGGSLEQYDGRNRVNVGDVSAIMIKRIPAIGKPFYTPDTEIALLKNWDEKIDQIIKTCLHEDIVMFGGVPTWNIVLFDKILDHTGKSNILEVWPNLNVYLHGGVSFEPYKDKFQKYLPREDFNYIEIYNASEGYFGVKDSVEGDMLLLTDANIYYEFIPLEALDNPYEHIIPLSEVEKGKTYALALTTAGGLTRYLVGDTIQFTSINPYRFKIVGRTAQFINTFGEEVMVSNTDEALSITCAKEEAIIKDYTVAPRYFNTDKDAGHQWVIEFEKPPKNIRQFEILLDENLRKVNSDYDAKRFKDMALKPLSVKVASHNTFHRWLESKNKLGGQHKVPRLANHRKYIEEIISFI
jgi:hypothetical protein